ncbi:serine/threonine protein kinase [Paeniglutamicibacter sp. NPDC091659]|uniref:serine/threonine protein kinase n=1 Tax=Paeniglutamicibacter sp. NPDC091659 TaxID=3364389 RepID=UPI0037FBEF72
METHDEPQQQPQIAGYDTNRYLGQGGNGTVWVIQDTGSGEELAVKIIGYDESLRRIGFRELNLRHEFLVHEYGMVDSSLGPGILMEYCPAGSAAAVVASRGPLSVGEVLTVIAPIAEALQFLHEQGVTHADVSPRNILFTAEGKPKLGDFGAHAIRGETPDDYGTNGFCAPEVAGVADPGELEPTRDVYALAACTWYLLTGRAPAPATSRIPIGAMVPEANDNLAVLLEDGLAIDPLRRPSAGQFAQRIFSAGDPIAVEFGSAVDPEALRHMVTTRQSSRKRTPLTRFKRSETRKDQAAVVPGDRGRNRGGRKPAHTPPDFPTLAGENTQSRLRRQRSGRTREAQGHRIHSLESGRRKLVIAGLLGIMVVASGAVLAQSMDIRVSQADAHEIGSPVDAVPVPTASGGIRPGPGRERDEILMAAADLTLRRDRIMLGADARALKNIHVPGSPSLARDGEILALMKRNGLKLESLQTSMEDASVVALGTNGSAFVEATSKQSGYRYVDGSGKAVFTAKELERQPVRLELRRDKGNWKIWDVDLTPNGQP